MNRGFSLAQGVIGRANEKTEKNTNTAISGKHGLGF